MGDAPTTIAFPMELPVARHGNDWIARAGERELRLTNLHKVFWPEAGYTKADLLTYYFNVAPTLLPYVTNRPLTLRRTPDGVDGPYWYEKDAPSYTPHWMPRLVVETEERDVEFLTIDDIASLLWIVNIGCIELHPHHTIGAVQENPTHAVFDLDPFPPAGFDDVRKVSGYVRVVLDRLHLRSFAKTSGAGGIHVYVPLDGSDTYEEIRRIVSRLCAVIHESDPESTTLEWEVDKRAGKVFLDANMNRAGASLVAPYSLRVRWNAPVSTPFAWDELDDIASAGSDIVGVFERLQAVDDPFSGVLEPGPSLKEAAAALGL